MGTDWYSRTLVFVTDIDAASAFYVGKLGFTEPWRHAEDGKLLVAQVQRAGCELLLTCQWPERIGKAIQFLSLDPDEFDRLQDECVAKGVATKDGQWGYQLLVIVDPDGNQLFIPKPNS
jgi:catechol 2,3-dioxygenase-like lactoylglutathione lyase family enzyme